MAGLLGYIAAGVAENVGKGISEQAKAQALAKREAAIAELQHSRQLQRDQASREFQTSERVAGQEFRAGESALERADAAELRRVAAAKEAAQAPDVKEFFDEQGNAYKAQWNTSTRSWDKIGGSKAAGSGGGVTIGPDGTIQVGGNAGTKLNVPSGFMVDPNDPKRLTPIPGGPGEQIGGENAGRIGIAKSFLEDLDGKDGKGGIRDAVKNGDATGIIDAGMGAMGLGQAGRLHARLDAGVDALQRMLSGAGTPDAETARYAKRYMATSTDTVETLTQKLDQLERELKNQMAIVTRGRGDVMGDGKKGGGDISTMSDADLEAIANGR